MGSSEQRIKDNHHDTGDTWGALKANGERAVRDWVEQLTSQDYLEKVGEYNTLQLTRKGQALFRDEGTEVPRLLKSTTTDRMKPTRTKGVPAEAWDGVHRPLFEFLRELRRDIAQEKSVPAYVIFGDAVLRDMARLRPSCLDSFVQVRGVGTRRMEQYGPRFTENIGEYCANHSLDTDVGWTGAVSTAETEAPGLIGEKKKSKTQGRNAAKSKAMELFELGHSVQEVAEYVKRALSTVEGYLVEYIVEQNITDPSPWVSPELAARISSVIVELDTDRLRPIYDKIGDEADYAQIRAVIACNANTPPRANVDKAEESPAFYDIESAQPENGVDFEVLALLKEGVRIDEVASTLSHDPKEVLGILTRYIEAEGIQSPLRWLDQATYMHIAQAAGQAESLDINHVEHCLQKPLPRSEIKVALACLRNRKVQVQ
jgi:ATP-dependent DNA helicase RecQ